MRKQVYDHSGVRFGMLTAIRLSDDYIKGQGRWLCKCDCGNHSVVLASNLTRNHTTSCGCHKKANFKVMNLTHGATANQDTRHKKYLSSYNIWCGMRQRCYNSNSPAYIYYGGRGIKVCERWHDYSNFVEDMGEKPKGLSLDRIDNNGDYSPQNCRWASNKEQMRNKSNAHLITYNGETKSLIEWAEHLGVSRGKLHNRIFNGWDIERAFTQPYRCRGDHVRSTFPIIRSCTESESRPLGSLG